MVRLHMNSGATMRYSNFRKDESSGEAFFIGEITMEIKICSGCNSAKSTTLFSKDAKSRDGISCHCKACCAIRFKNWVAKNKERKAASDAAYYLRTREHHLEQSKIRYLSNPEKERIYRAEWYLKNSEIVKKRAKDWNAANPEKRNNGHYKRRKLKNSGEGISKGLRDKLMWLQGKKCACCNIDISASCHMDHIMPLALGGNHEDINIQLLCPKCNLQKNAKHPVNFMQSKGFLI